MYTASFVGLLPVASQSTRPEEILRVGQNKKPFAQWQGLRRQDAASSVGPKRKFHFSKNVPSVVCEAEDAGVADKQTFEVPTGTPDSRKSERLNVQQTVDIVKVDVTKPKAAEAKVIVPKLTGKVAVVDGCEAAAHVAHACSESIAIYPISPSSPMGEFSEEWSANGRPNIWGTVPTVVQMQSEAGVAGALHGVLQSGALSTTYTASQGLLLMIPNMYKIAGELIPTVIHVAARALATHALSIFGDHSDVMAARSTGWAMLASGSVQEVMDMAMISHAATLESRIPFMHFFDGYRTSHEINKVSVLSEETMREMINPDLVRAHRERALSPEHPVLRGSAQNPDVYFQSREAANPFYNDCPGAVQTVMDRFAKLTGRQYHLFDYHGAPDADRVMIIMGSGAEVAHDTVVFLNKTGSKVGVLKVRLYRPFNAKAFVHALPKTVKFLSVLDRTKDPCAMGEPLYKDVVTALVETDKISGIKVIGGRYGLSSKEFTPAMVKASFDEFDQMEPKRHFTVGIDDDVTHLSLEVDKSFKIEDPSSVQVVLFGLGSDGTVGASKNSIKIIGEGTDSFVQGFFVYDSKKAGSLTTSHLRFQPQPIRNSYLITKAGFVGCHQFAFLERYDILDVADHGSTFLLNSPYSKDDVWDLLPVEIQRGLIEKDIKFYVIDGYTVAKENGMGSHINTIMQTCFFAISGVLPRDDAIAAIKKAIKKTYSKKGEAVVQKNYKAVDATLEHLHQVTYPDTATATKSVEALRMAEVEHAPEFVQKVTSMLMSGHGDQVPVSYLPSDGTFLTGTSQFEKRNLALTVPQWAEDTCVQCGKCVMVCPHSAIRAKVYDPSFKEEAPSTFRSVDAKGKKEWQGLAYTLQVATEDCTGCTLCVHVCPVEGKAIHMVPQPDVRDAEKENWDYFMNVVPDPTRSNLNARVKDVQVMRPLFEFSGACSGCGEAPYIRLLTQLYGDRAVIANATGCSSIFGGNLPTTPYAVNDQGRGPAWANSLFEDNAEFGMGIRLGIDKQMEHAHNLMLKLKEVLGSELVDSILTADQSTDALIDLQRDRVNVLKDKLREVTTVSHSSHYALDSTLVREAKDLFACADTLIKRSVWIMGGDGWAYDIGYGGLDHVMSTGLNVNILVLDTELYSNTGGQSSKATPRGAVAKFASHGRHTAKKDLALMATTYGNVYVARIAMGADDLQTLKVFKEAEAYNGPSLIIAYSHCVGHGYDLAEGLEHQKEAVKSGYWPLFRFNPDNEKQGKNPFMLDSRPPTMSMADTVFKEGRFSMLSKFNPEEGEALLLASTKDAERTYKMYQHMAKFYQEEKEETPKDQQ